jgi:hypothetical protein
MNIELDQSTQSPLRCGRRQSGMQEAVFHVVVVICNIGIKYKVSHWLGTLLSFVHLCLPLEGKNFGNLGR